MKSLSNYILESQQIKLDSDGKEHGFEYVDLGLPSCTMWATCNVGADKPEDFGLLFQYGQTKGCKYGVKTNDFVKFSKAPKSLKLSEDAAHANMGENGECRLKEILMN